MPTKLQFTFSSSFCLWPHVWLRSKTSIPVLVVLFSSVFRQVMFGWPTFLLPACVHARSSIQLFSSFILMIRPVQCHLVVLTFVSIFFTLVWTRISSFHTTHGHLTVSTWITTCPASECHFHLSSTSYVQIITPSTCIRTEIIQLLSVTREWFLTSRSYIKFRTFLKGMYNDFHWLIDTQLWFRIIVS